MTTHEQRCEQRIDQLETVIRVLLGGQEEDYAIKLGIPINPTDTVMNWAREILHDHTWAQGEVAA